MYHVIPVRKNLASPAAAGYAKAELSNGVNEQDDRENGNAL